MFRFRVHRERALPDVTPASIGMTGVTVRVL